ncbi:MAG TPA: DUF4126 domain-containing protein [Casimicrobiaceae bacterium]|nr:DUF4126 domain-containing protein [Casimicrobiaceae bacterium]
MTHLPGIAQLDTWQLIALAAALGWASGVRLYIVLFVIGGLGWLGWIDLPHGLQVLAHPWVLGASGFMMAMEFFADKVPGLDSLWDLVHTFIRIPAGAALAASVFSDAPGAATVAAAILGGSLAAGAHFTKTGARALINTSPEPFSNWAASFGEELAVGTMLWMAFTHPIAAGIVLLAIIAAMVWILPKLWRFITGSLRRLSGMARPSAPPPAPENHSPTRRV